jgi:hypothetical protein
MKKSKKRIPVKQICHLKNQKITTTHLETIFIRISFSFSKKKVPMSLCFVEKNQRVTNL